MLETIRQFAEDQLFASGTSDDVRTAHAHYFAQREDDLIALWDGPGQRQAYEWVAIEMSNLRVAFRWAADRCDLDTATSIAHYAAFVGYWGEHHEPLRWNEELIEPARAVAHRRLAQLYAIAALCFTHGRIDESLRYVEAGQAAVTSGRFDETRPEVDASLGSPYAVIGEAARWADWCRNVIARRPSANSHAKGLLALALKMAGQDEQAVAAAECLPSLADSTDNPNLAAWTLFTYGTAMRNAEPAAAYAALRKGLRIAQDSGSRMTESTTAAMLSPLAIAQGDLTGALGYLVVSLRYYHDSGAAYLVNTALTPLIVLLDRVGRYEPAATICGFALDPFSRSSLAEIGVTEAHLRDVLGPEVYEPLSRTGRQMNTAEMVRYAYEQMDLLRAELG